MKSYSTITSKGQVTIPTKVRNRMKLLPGVKLEFFIEDDHITLIPINKTITDSRGILPKPKKTLTVEEMNKVIRDSYSRHYDRH